MKILDFSTFVFDLDGVVVNSEFYHYECYRDSIKKYENYLLEYDEYCKIHHSLNYSFKNKFSENYEKIYQEKHNLYKNKISTLKLVEGFYEFFTLLIKTGKIICIVTDSQSETFKLVCDKFSFLKKINFIVTRNEVSKRKPDSSCYLNLLKKLPDDIENHEIIAFEDSYKGWTAASGVIYNCVLVNNSNYVYYDKIKAKNIIPDFKQVIDLSFKTKFDYAPFYISSKTIHREKWLELQNFFPIEATWININKHKNEITIDDKYGLCEAIQKDIISSKFGILYLEKNEKDHIGSLIEIGLLLANSKKIYVCGDNIFKDEVLFNFKEHFIFSRVNNFNLFKTFLSIQYDISEDYQNFNNNITKKKIIDNDITVQEYNNNMDYVVICASGKGTRLFPITIDIPKLLVNVGNLNILNKIVNYWKKYTSKFVIVVESKYNAIVDFYLKLLNIQYEIINVICDNGQENSYTLHNALKDAKFTDKKILITWCDIFPETFLSFDIFNNTNIIFTYKNFGRYDANNNEIIQKPYGNVIGIYYFGAFNHVNIFEPKMDICDCYKTNFGDFTTFEIEKLVDVGDYQKLYNYLNAKCTNYNSRYFNNISNSSAYIIEKRSTCNYGNKIIINEMGFYKYHKLDNMPEILEFGENFFKMKKIINASNFIDKFNLYSINNQKRLISKLMIEIEKIHNIETYNVCKTTLLNDIRIEFYSKIMQRLENIKPLLSYFNYIKSVNNINIEFEHEYILEKIYEKLSRYFIEHEGKYNTIHGDPHMSNILIDYNNKLWFIDPRGYFGETKIFGPREYDISKIIYSLSGFDEINNNDRHFFTINDDNISTNINNNINTYLHMFEKYDRDVLINMTILHWFGLTDYSKNNIHKCISSYYYGIYLYHLYYKNT